MNRTDFFKTLYQFSEGQIEVRPLPGARAFFNLDDFSGIDSHYEKYNSSNLYFGIATRNGNGGGKDSLINIPCVWCDVDFKNTPREIAAQKIKEFPFRPSIYVKSGGGIHLYWLLKEPAGKDDIATIEDINHRIADQLGGDHNACDAARILRVPDTRNHKYNPARLCEVTQCNDFYYTLDNFLEILPESTYKSKSTPPESENNNWLSEAMLGVSEGNRNATATKIAGYWINKLSQKEVLTILTTWNLSNNPPLSQPEIEIIARSVSRYGPEISTKSRVDISNVYDSSRMIEEYKAYIQTLKKNRFITGVGEIDKRIRGVAGGEVLTIIARSGSFKTAMLQNLLKNYIQNSSWAAVFFSIELPVSSMTERYLEILDGATGKEVEELFSDNDEIQKAVENQFVDDLKNLFVIPNKVSLSDVSAYVQLIEREKNIKVGVIGIDYLGLMHGPGVSEYEVVSRLATGLKSTAKLLNIPAVLLSQVSRKGASGNVEISLDMGRGSGAIEEAADFVLGLWQAADGADKQLICKILKNRKGRAGSCWKLDLIPQTFQIGPNSEKYDPVVEQSKGGF